MKFLLLACVALAQIHRMRQPTYGREDGQQQRYGGMTRGRRQRTPRYQSHFGRFGGRTDVNRRDQRYGTNHHLGRYGGYTRRYIRGQNGARGHFGGRRDPFRSDTSDNRRGYNPYRNHNRINGHGEDRLGSLCTQMSAQEAQRECSNYTGRQGCEATCAKFREERMGLSRFGRRGRTTGRRTTGRFGRRTGTQRRGFPTQRRGGMSRGGMRNRLRIPTQGGTFGRRTRGRTTGRRSTYTRNARGHGHNGFFSGRLGHEGHQTRTHSRGMLYGPAHHHTAVHPQERV